MGFVGSAAIGYPKKVTSEQLAKMPLITFSRASSMRPVLEAFFAGPDLPQPKLHTSNSLATIVQMAKDGIGLAFIPLKVAFSDIENGSLVEVATALQIPDSTFSACWLATSAKSLVTLAAELAVEAAGQFDTVQAR
jgi:DNA-binding transcriptional LysR family regulator